MKLKQPFKLGAKSCGKPKDKTILVLLVFKSTFFIRCRKGEKMKTTKDKKLTVDTSIATLDKLLIKNGLKPTRPANKEGTYIYISNKSKNH